MMFQFDRPPANVRFTFNFDLKLNQPADVHSKKIILKIQKIILKIQKIILKIQNKPQNSNNFWRESTRYFR